jgi:hypothetical protein
MSLSNKCVIGRDDNVVMVDFKRKPEPPAPRFPGASALRAGGDDRGKNLSPTQRRAAAR